MPIPPSFQALIARFRSMRPTWLAANMGWQRGRGQRERRVCTYCSFAASVQAARMAAAGGPGGSGVAPPAAPFYLDDEYHALLDCVVAAPERLRLFRRVSWRRWQCQRAMEAGLRLVDLPPAAREDVWRRLAAPATEGEALALGSLVRQMQVRRAAREAYLAVPAAAAGVGAVLGAVAAAAQARGGLEASGLFPWCQQRDLRFAQTGVWPDGEWEAERAAVQVFLGRVGAPREPEEVGRF
jgi:hypothetical protein